MQNAISSAIETSFVPVPLTVFGIESSGAMPGLSAFESHPHLPRVMPFVFNEDTLRPLQYAWLREVNRAEHKPRRGLWISGPKGAGKTTTIEQFFARLGVPVASLTANREFRVLDAIVSKTLRPLPNGGMEIVYQDGPLAQAMRGGYPIILNELDLADPGELTGLNDIVDRGVFVVPDTGEVIRAKRGFLVCVTANSNGGGDSTGEYAGVGTMNTALMSRFFKFKVNYPTLEEELKVLVAAGVVNLGDAKSETVARKVLEIGGMIRDAYQRRSSGLTSPISTRELIDIVEAAPNFQRLAARGENVVKYAFALCYTNGLEPAAEEAVKQIIEKVIA
jgi:cobaltochelatase CobS